jgi:beta-glucosidase-like glycosyl hydrolase
MLGIHINFAPVMEVNSGTSQLEVAYHAFGENGKNAKAKGMAYMQGMEDYGLIACYRHMSESQVSTEITASQNISSDPAQISSSPYITYSEQHPLGTLVARLNEPVADFSQGRSIIRSSFLEADMLAGRMALDGLVFSDAINGEERAAVKPGEPELEALLAGNDILMFPNDIAAAIKRIKKAVNEHQISQDEINRRIGKILEVKYKAGLSGYAPVNIENNFYHKLNSPEAILLK